MDYIFILPTILVAFTLVFGGLFVSSLLAPRNSGKIKSDTYECGEKTIGSSSIQFNVGYYLFGLIFLVFDVEAVFLFPWALVVREMGVYGLIEAIIFVCIFFMGLIYAWRKGALEWV